MTGALPAAASSSSSAGTFAVRLQNDLNHGLVKLEKKAGKLQDRFVQQRMVRVQR